MAWLAELFGEKLSKFFCELMPTSSEVASRVRDPIWQFMVLTAIFVLILAVLYLICVSLQFGVGGFVLGLLAACAFVVFCKKITRLDK